MTQSKKFLGGLFGGKTPDADERETGAEGGAARTVAETPKKQSFFERLTNGLSRSSQRLSESLSSIVAKRKLDEAALDEIEEQLIAADLGVVAAADVRERLAADRFERSVSEEEVKEAVAAVVADRLQPHERPLAVDPAKKPHVVLVVGVNGGGKTTTIGKLAARWRDEGLNVMLAAADTFRAAAVDQLRVWGERAGATVIAKDAGADAAGLAYEALERARRERADALIIDTAGRLQNRRELMDELAKIVRVLKKLDPEAPHDTLLVLDATVGQNALSQADAFREIAGVTGLVMTKLDGTAKGGVLVALADRHPLPIHFIGVGERAEDLQPFEAKDFARALAGLSGF